MRADILHTGVGLYSNYFQELRTDVEGAYYGFYFMDLAGYSCKGGQDGETEDTEKLLYQTLRALTNIILYSEWLIRCIYEFKGSLYREREGPQVMECIMCGRGKKRVESFSITAGWCDMHNSVPDFLWESGCFRRHYILRVHRSVLRLRNYIYFRGKRRCAERTGRNLQKHIWMNIWEKALNHWRCWKQLLR